MNHKGIFSFASLIDNLLQIVLSKRPQNELSLTWIYYDYTVVIVLSLGHAILTVRITEAFGLPKPSLFCNVQRDVASLPSYIKLNSKCDS